MGLFARTRIETPCRIEVRQDWECLGAHVELDGDIAIRPGDRVRVHGDPIRVAFGEQATLKRTATIERAGPLARVWTRLAGHFALTELYEVSFTPRSQP
ncbi:hypothetical protein ABC347_11935 [Sphingomonas sp. 1P06PA]|uniref:hypothetical protein n=1 Tax=Sphingomonas sp. 1P06PA TaxID=554121 RepID=UPI0039A4B4F7